MNDYLLQQQHRARVRTATWIAVAVGIFLLLSMVLPGTVMPQQRPVAAFNATCTGLACSFSGAGTVWPTTPPGHTSADPRSWDPGDGTGFRAGSSTFQYTYQVAGVYRATYRACWAPSGLCDDSTRTLYVGVSPPPPNQPPVARFSGTCTALTCRFNGRASTDDVAIIAWSWRFGDSTAANGDTVVHLYPRAGTWTVELYVNDSAGLFSVARQAMTTSLPIPPGFSGPRLTVAQGRLRALLAYRWFFGDGQRVLRFDTLSLLIERLMAKRISPARLGDIEAGRGAPPDSAEEISIAATLGLLFDQRGDPNLPIDITNLWHSGEAERRRRGLP